MEFASGLCVFARNLLLLRDMKKIVVTGAGGFIASNLVKSLSDKGFSLVLVDDFTKVTKQQQIRGIKYEQLVQREKFFDWLDGNANEVEFVFHLGARTDTTEFDFSILEELNLSYSKKVWTGCTEKQIPLLYASSAATYGSGENGFADNESDIPKLKPLNPYGKSKQLFDEFVLAQKMQPPFWCGLKFFNVYGLGEIHKGRMASVVFHAYNQIKQNGSLKLFQSHRTDFKDGEQLRDFVFVDDVVDVCLFFYENRTAKRNGIYNLGTGKARTFNDLGKAVFASLNLEPNISYISIPKDIREKYQYFTEAGMEKLRGIGYTKEFTRLESGVRKYVEFLQKIKDLTGF